MFQKISKTLALSICALIVFGGVGTASSAALAAAPSFSSPAVVVPPTIIFSESADQIAVVTNSGSADLTFGAGAVSISGANSTEFRIKSDACSNTTVAPSQTCTVTFSAIPNTYGTKSADLVFTDNAPNSPQHVSISGSVVDTPVFWAGVKTHVSAVIGQKPAIQRILISNSGYGTLNFPMQGGIKKGKNASDFYFESNNCSNISLNRGATCGFFFTFKPKTSGPKTVTFMFKDNAAGSPHSVTITEIAQAPVTITKLSVTSGPFNGGTPLTITGKGFDKKAQVYIDGQHAVVTQRKGSTSLTVITPSTSNVPRAVLIQILNPDTGSAQTSAFSYK